MYKIPDNIMNYIRFFLEGKGDYGKMLALKNDPQRTHGSGYFEIEFNNTVTQFYTKYFSTSKNSRSIAEEYSENFRKKLLPKDINDDEKLKENIRNFMLRDQYKNNEEIQNQLYDMIRQIFKRDTSLGRQISDNIRTAKGFFDRNEKKVQNHVVSSFITSITESMISGISTFFPKVAEFLKELGPTNILKLAALGYALYITIQIIQGTTTVVLFFGKIVYNIGSGISSIFNYVFKRDPVVEKINQDLQQAIEEDVVNYSGCYLFDMKSGNSYRIPLLSCNKDIKLAEVSFLQTCSSTDVNCDGKFNPCVRDSKNIKGEGGILPSTCSKIVGRKEENKVDGVQVYIACDKNNPLQVCSRFCDIKNFDYDPERYNMICQDVSGNDIAITVFSLLTNTPVEEVVEKLLETPKLSYTTIEKYIYGVDIVLIVILIFMIFYRIR